MKKQIFFIGFLFFGFFFVTQSAEAATYYVATTGNDANSCATVTNINTPRRTIAGGLSCLSGGDTLTIKSGTYTEGIAYNAIPSGLSDQQRTIVRGAPGETVIINGATAGYTIAIMNRDYITLDGLIIDAANAAPNTAAMVVGSTGSSGDPGAHYITLQNSVLRRTGGGNSTIEGFETHGYPSGLSHHLRLNNVEIYGFGSSISNQIHAVYTNASDSIIENSTIHDNHGGHGIHQFSSDNTNFASNNIYRNNRIYNNNGSFCIGIYSGTNNLIYNNLCYGNGGTSGFGGIRADYGSNGAKIYHNTVYQNMGPAVYIGSGASNTVVKNNIGYNNGSDSINNAGTGTTFSNNLFINPIFANASIFDFHLQSTSPAINAGATLGSPYNVDFEGTLRPQGSAYDIGAYEYVSAIVTPTPTPILNPTVTTNKSSYTAGETMTVTIDGGNSNVQEWVALYVASNPDSSYSFDNNWKYLNGTQTVPSSPVPYPAILSFTAPSTSGTYNFRYFPQNGYANRLAISSNITISSPTPTPTPSPTTGSSTCDLNKDSQTNILDLQNLANVILGKSTCSGNCDINKDGSVNILDLQFLANVILGKSICA